MSNHKCKSMDDLSAEDFDALTEMGQVRYLANLALSELPSGIAVDESRRCMTQIFDMLADEARRPVETVAIPEERVALANDALMEIAEISQLLRIFISDNDQCGSVKYVARGMLARIENLSDAIVECLEPRDNERQSDADIFKAIECRAKPKDHHEEVAHG